MRLRLFITITLIQACVIIGLFFLLRSKQLGVLKYSTNTINSNLIIHKSRGDIKYFYEPKPNTIEKVNKEWLYNTPTYTINKDSLNERFDYKIQKEQGIYRIVTLGDSFTFGENVSTKDNYSEKLEDLLNSKCRFNKFEVINLGVYGYDIQYMTERYKKRGVKYQPDLVIMLFGDFQLFRLNDELKRRVDKIKSLYRNMDDTSAYAKASEEMIRDLGWNSILKWQKNQIDQLVNSISSEELIIKFPVSCNSNTYTWFGQSFECWPFNKYNNYFKEASVKRKNIYFLNDLDRKNINSLQDGHPSVEGHKTIAEEIFTYLQKNNLLPCKK